MRQHTKPFFWAYGLLFGYFLQGILYPTGSLISQGFILIFLLISLFAFLKNFHLTRMPGFMKVWTLFCAIQIITFIVSPKYVYGTVYEAIGKVATYNQMKDIFTYCLSIFIGLNVGKRVMVNTKTLAKLGLVILGLAAVRFTFSAAESMEEYGRQVTNNASYNFVTVIPFLPFIFQHYKRLGFIVIAVIIGFTITGAKRGALVCSAVSLAFYALWYYKTHKVGFKNLALGIILGTALLGFTAYSYSQNEYLQNRLADTEKGGIGPREIGYAVMFNHWVNDDNPFTWLFGNGSTQTVTVWGNFGHNDWLEILIDNGLVGVILYAAFFIGATFYIRRTKYMTRENKLVCYLILLTWFLKTCFSMGYSGIWNAFTMVLLGLMIGNSILTRRRWAKVKPTATPQLGNA